MEIEIEILTVLWKWKFEKYLFYGNRIAKNCSFMEIDVSL